MMQSEPHLICPQVEASPLGTSVSLDSEPEHLLQEVKRIYPSIRIG